MFIVKRNGKREKFDPEKIKKALEKANLSVSEEHRISQTIINNIANKVEQLANEKETMFTVEDIQNAIEDYLITANKFELTRACIKYRYIKAMAKNKYAELMDAVAKKVSGKDIVNQNANLDEKSFGGRLGETTSLIMKQYALDYCVSPTTRDNHINNMIYIHDQDHMPIGDHNCAHENSWVYISNDKWDTMRYMQLKDLAKEINLKPNQEARMEDSDYFILARDGWTKLKGMTSRYMEEGEPLYTIKTHSGIPLKLTGKHRVPVIRNNEEILSEVKDLQVGDCLIDVDRSYINNKNIFESSLNWKELNDKYPEIGLRVCGTRAVGRFLRYKYNIDLTNWAKKNQVKDLCNLEKIEFDKFEKLIEEYPIPYELYNSLSVCAMGGKKRFPIHVPLTPELAKIFAFIYADGGVYYSKEQGTYLVEFTNTNPDIIEEFQRCYEKCFGFRLKSTSAINEWGTKGYWLYETSKLIYYLLHDFAGAKKKRVDDISIPDWVMGGSEDIKISYLAACVDTDGCWGTRELDYTSCCEKYCEQLVLLMNSLGYHSYKTPSGKAGVPIRFGYRVTKSKYDTYSVRLSRVEELKDLYNKLNTIKRKDSYLADKSISRIFKESKILSIKKEEYSGVVYDLETESHWYIINDYVSHNCLTIPFDQLLSEGFNTRQTDVRASGSINTALQLVAVIFQLQSLVQFGGVSAPTLDTTLVPYVRKSFSKYFVDEMKDRKPKWKKEVPKELSFNDPEFTRRKYRKIYRAAMRLIIKETHQAVEALYHNLNTLQSRSGNQLPFSSINFGLCTEPEGRLLSKEFLEVCREGLGKYHRTSIFPCVIFQCKKGINIDPKDPNYDLFKLALQCTSERLYPNYGNCDWSVQKKWVAEDREIKNRVINELSKEDKKKLIERVKNNKDLQYVLALDENAVPLKEEQRYEVFSTMGKLKGTAHVKSFELC